MNEVSSVPGNYEKDTGVIAATKRTEATRAIALGVNRFACFVQVISHSRRRDDEQSLTITEDPK